MPWQNFLKSTVVHSQWVTCAKTGPLLLVICYPFGKTWYQLATYKIWPLDRSSFDHSRDIDGPPKF